MFEKGTKVRVNAPGNAAIKYPGFFRAFQGKVGKLIKLVEPSMDRKMYPESFAHVGFGKEFDEFMVIDQKWLMKAT
jgi:hypothetical protein